MAMCLCCLVLAIDVYGHMYVLLLLIPANWRGPFEGKKLFLRLREILGEKKLAKKCSREHDFYHFGFKRAKD